MKGLIRLQTFRQVRPLPFSPAYLFPDFRVLWVPHNPVTCNAQFLHQRQVKFEVTM
uniref:Uncharacterized protein n=1 Tax=Mus spicilegus TaxID=10103 RepID=A0A8C6GA84_MUSSI